MTFRLLGGAGATCALLGLIVPVASIRPAHPPISGTEHPPDAFRHPSFLSEITNDFEWSEWGVERVELVIAAVLVAAALVGLNWAVDRPATRALVGAGGVAIWAAASHVSASFNLSDRAGTGVWITRGHAEDLLLVGGAALVVAPIAALMIGALGRLLRSAESGD